MEGASLSLDEFLHGEMLLFKAVVVGSRWERMVLLEEAHDTLSEVGHVLADHEGEVTGLDLLVVYDIVTDAVTSPFGVGNIGQDVL